MSSQGPEANNIESNVTPSRRKCTDTPSLTSQELSNLSASYTGPSRLIIGSGSIPVFGRVGGSEWSRERQAVKNIDELERQCKLSCKKQDVKKPKLFSRK